MELPVVCNIEELRNALCEQKEFDISLYEFGSEEESNTINLRHDMGLGHASVWVPTFARALERTQAPIQSLKLVGNCIEYKEALVLARALERTQTPLQHLDLSINRIGDDGARALARALEKTQTPLQSLELSHNEI